MRKTKSFRRINPATKRVTGNRPSDLVDGGGSPALSISGKVFRTICRSAFIDGKHFRTDEVCRMISASQQAWELIRSTLLGYLTRQRDQEEAQKLFLHEVDQTQQAGITATIENSRLSYRDIGLIQMAFALISPGLDTTIRPPGARSVGGELGKFLKENHIKAIADGYQNCGKNDTNLVRGNEQAFDSLLIWMKTASQEQLLACFEYYCSQIAASSRPVKAMPDLDTSRLTFGRVLGLMEDLLAIPSQGAFEQYIAAAMLYGFNEQNQQAGASSSRVETKRLNASDRSAGTAGDIEVLIGNRTLDAYEVTANDWHGKVSGAVQKMKEHDLTRIAVIAPVNTMEYPMIAQELLAVQEDVAILDLRGTVAFLLSQLTKPFRHAALKRLYEYLDRYSEKTEQVNLFVDLLMSRGLTVGSVEQGEE